MMRNNTANELVNDLKRGYLAATTSVVVSLMCLSPLVSADELLTLDESNFGLRIEGDIENPVNTLRTLINVNADGVRYDVDDTNNLDHLLDSYQSRGVNIQRLHTEWTSKLGTVTVGNDWSNFQDSLLPENDGASDSSMLAAPDQKRISTQIAWSSGSGFSVALEESPDKPDVADSDVGTLQALTDQSPSLVLSWRGELAENAGYELSALGRKLDVNGVYDGVKVDDSALGWGVKLSGDWRVGNVFAALKVTLSDGIDSLILKQFGSDVAVTPSGQATTLKSISILPSLSYRLGENSDLRAALGRYQATDNTDNGIDTLDTINLGYRWNPWPSAKFAIEVIGKDYKGTVVDENSTEIKVGAEKQF